MSFLLRLALLGFTCASFVLTLYEVYIAHIFRTNVFLYYDYEQVLYNDPSSVHITFVVEGSQEAVRAIAALKSILYFQGRISDLENSCILEKTHLPEPICAGIQQPRHNFISLHVIGNADVRSMFNAHLSMLKLRNFRWNFYRIENYLTKLNYIPSVYKQRPTDLLQLLLPEILPPEVVKTIVLQPEVLLNENIAELWDHFDRFDKEQIYAGATDQTELEECNLLRAIYDRKIHNGVLLMKLQVMRERNWSVLWRHAMQKLILENPALPLTVTDILHTITVRNPTVLYRLSGEWNVQLSDQNANGCRSVVWPNRRPDEPDCITRPGEPSQPNRPNMAKLITFPHHPDPTAEDCGKGMWANHSNVNRSLSSNELKERYRSMYRIFKDLSLSCFH
ncbi:unnamed protein product [Calicophoron daubneyi]|uniref:Uncharacterized protein n=1 Tax=Calicophoron daubneyi TaxID=300641 RepID=A0AAV2TDM0_CALDB